MSFDIVIFAILAMVLITCSYVIKVLRKKLEKTSIMIIPSTSNDIEEGDEVLYSKGKRGIVLKCPDTGLSYTILTKNGSIKFAKYNELIKTGYSAKGLLKFLEAWRGINNER